MTAWAIAFLLTVGIEAPIVAAILASRATRGHLVVPAAIGAQIVTHPVLWLAVPPVASMGYVIVAELTVVVVEAHVYALALAAPVGRCAIAAFVANAASFGFGLVAG